MVYNQITTDKDGNIYQGYYNSQSKIPIELDSFENVSSSEYFSGYYNSPTYTSTEDFVIMVSAEKIFKLSNGSNIFQKISSLCADILRPDSIPGYTLSLQSFTDIEGIPNSNLIYATVFYGRYLTVPPYTQTYELSIIVIDIENETVIRDNSNIIGDSYKTVINSIICIDENTAIFVQYEHGDSGYFKIYRTDNQANGTPSNILSYTDSNNKYAMITMDMLKGYIYVISSCNSYSRVYRSIDNGLNFSNINGNILPVYSSDRAEGIFEWTADDTLVTIKRGYLVYSNDDGITWDFSATNFSYVYDAYSGIKRNTGELVISSNSGTLMLSTKLMLGTIWETQPPAGYTNNIWNNIIEDNFNNLYITSFFRSSDPQSNLLKSADFLSFTPCTFDSHFPTRFATNDDKHLTMVKQTTDFIVISNKYSIYKMNHGEIVMTKISSLSSWQDSSSNYIQFRLIVPILNTNKIWVVYEDDSYNKFVGLADLDTGIWIKQDIELPSSYNSTYVFALDGIAIDEERAMFMFGVSNTIYIKVAITETGHDCSILNETLNIATENYNIEVGSKPSFAYHSFSGNIYIPPQGYNKMYYTEDGGVSWKFNIADNHNSPAANIEILSDDETQLVTNLSSSNTGSYFTFDGVNWQQAMSDLLHNVVDNHGTSRIKFRNDGSMIGLTNSSTSSKVFLTSIGSTDKNW